MKNRSEEITKIDLIRTGYKTNARKFKRLFDFGHRAANRMQTDHKLTKASEVDLDFPFNQFETAEEVQHAVDKATSLPNVILFVHVSWAPMVHQRKRFADFKQDYELKHSTSDLEFHYIDCTPVSNAYEPLRNLEGWKTLEEKNNGLSLVHGYGELVWCKNGRVMHVEQPLKFDSIDEMIAKTETLGMVGFAK